MVIRSIIPSITFSEITIFDVGEENNAVMTPHLPDQRFHYIIHFIVEGYGIYSTSSPSIATNNKIGEKNAFAIYPNDTVFYKSDEQTPLHYYWIGFDGVNAEELLSYIGFSKHFPVIQISDKEETIRAFNELYNAWNKHDSFLLCSKFYNLISILRSNNQSIIKKEAFQVNNLLLQRAENIIKSNIHRNLQVNELVEILHIDRSYFSKVFKENFNISPHAYIIKLRLLHAETLLKTTNKSITEIVNILNFTDTYSFSKQFKKQFKYSPSEYRERIKNNNL